MKKLFILLFLIPIQILAQEKIEGNVKGQSNNGNILLVGANVFWLKHQQGTTTDKNGNFSIEKNSESHELVISYVGFVSDTIHIHDQKNINVVLKSSIDLNEFEVSHREKSTTISAINPIKVENLGQKELRKAACCNLSESFETNPTVDVSYADAVTGTRQINMLGLSGRYSMISRELIPSIRTLSNIQGLQFVPGPWVHSIQIAKGAGSVVHGFESMTGQINFEIFNPETADKLYLNAYTNTGFRQEINLITSHKVSEKAATAILFHANGRFGEFDMNNDNFLDMPTGRQINFMNRWQFYTKNGWEAQAGIHTLYDERASGEMENKEPEIRNSYQINMKERMFDVFAKAGYNFERPSTSLGFQFNARLHDNKSSFGIRTYDAQQNSFFYNSIFQSYINNTNHQFKIGTGGQIDNISEQVNSSIFTNQLSNTSFNFNRNEISHGIFAEYTFSKHEKLDLILGIRGDYHNYFGVFATPRLHFRYAPTQNTIIRASAGRGQRTTNLIADHFSFLASSRRLTINIPNPNLPYGFRPEVSYNYGLNITQNFKLNYRDAYLSLDLYRTDFANRIIADWDHNPQQMLFYERSFGSFANTIQTEFSSEIFKRFDMKLAWRYFENKSLYTSGWLLQALLPRHRAFANFSYETHKEKWLFDLTAIWTGSQRLPSTLSNPEEFRLDSNVPNYFTFNAQIAYKANQKTEVYIGFENFTNFRINDAIIQSENPYGNYFDTNYAWGPIFGRMIYAGFRYRIPQAANK